MRKNKKMISSLFIGKCTIFSVSEHLTFIGKCTIFSVSEHLT